MPEGRDVKLRQPRERVARLARCEHERDPLPQQAASHERERPRRRTIEPLRVVDDAQERPVLRSLGQQAEDRQPDQERIRRGVGGVRNQSERDAKRLVLRLRETVQEVQEGRTQLPNRGERELHLGFDPGRPGDPKLARSPDRVLEQRRLADARFAIRHQHAAAPAAHAIQEPVEHLALAFTAEQPPS
jgi:hypothetical protein